VRRIGVGAVAAVAVGLTTPSLASAVCSLPGSHQLGFSPAGSVDSSVPASDQGAYLQIPFTVPPGTAAIHIRYCYDSGSTLDMGVYEPLRPGDSVPGMPERRGWSGSAVKDLAIAVNGFSPPATYESGRKAFVSGYTTRAYQPGPIPAGTWTLELGLASLGAPSVAYQVDVETTSDSSWSDDPYQSAPPVGSGIAIASPGWYAGDVHAHGEQEPGNALVKTSLDYAFKPLAQGGAGLDWIGLVDHNNDISRGEIGKYESGYPGKLIIPGTEVTTYHGHYNSIGSTAFADFRGGPVLDQSLDQVAPTTLPASQFAQLQAGGGWTQVNHPTIFPGAPSVCRGCPWDWTDAETDFSHVDAIELQTGPADLGGTQNPFTKTAIEFYEARLAAGFHIAAVGSSDSHQADQADITTAPIGKATTVVSASALSQAAIVEGVRADHTYVKFYGNDGPDIRPIAHAPGAPDATIGDTIAGERLDLEVAVTGAGPGAARPGDYQLVLLRDGAVAGRVAIPGDLTHTFSVSDPGRYSIEILRTAPNADRYEIYSSPVWFERADNLRLGKAKLNKRKGTAKLSATVAHPGKLKLTGKGLKSSQRTVAAAGKVKLKLQPKGKLARKLRERGKAKLKAKVKFIPTDGEPALDSKKLKLKRR
jgi:hypothetical protein